MPRTTTISAMTLVSVTMFAATASLAHETDVHHWFEHQRALGDGGYLLDQSPLVVPSSTEVRSRAGVRTTEKSAAKVAPDCLIEEMKRTENYLPSGVCAHGRPIIDDSREDKRNRMR